MQTILDKSTFDALLGAAHEMADATGPAILTHFRAAPSVENKAGEAGFDPVTQADRQAESIVADYLRQKFPEHGMVGEEFGAQGAKGRFKWIVDPIDGTRAFIMGSPLWGTLIGLLEDDKPCFGLMDQPFTGERYWCDQGASYLRHGENDVAALSTRKECQLRDAVLATTHPDLFASDTAKEGFARIKRDVRMSRFGGDCYNYALLAAGHVDLVVESDLKAHDIMPLIPIIERAGGIVTTWQGDAAVEGGDIVAAGDGNLHQQALECLNKSA